MQFATLKNLSKALVTLLVLSACAKTNYDGSTRAHPFENKLQQPPANVPPATTQGTPDTTPTVKSVLPILSFVETEVMMDDQLVAQLELQLSQASTSTVTADVTLEPATAIHYIDYNGFKIDGKIKQGRNEAETRQTVVFPPGTTRLTLPDIGGRATRHCNAYFNAKLNPNTVQQAQVVDDTARITVACMGDTPSQPLPPPVVVPPPTVEVPPTQPCPPQQVQGPVEARFEHEMIKEREHSRRAKVEIELDQTSTLPVTIDVQTQDGSALAGQDYHPVNIQLTIPAGKKSISFPVELIGGHRCKLPGQRGDEARFEFAVIATRIANANMQRPQAIISIEKDLDKCPEPPVAAPPVIAPAPTAPCPPVVAPEPKPTPVPPVVEPAPAPAPVPPVVQPAPEPTPVPPVVEPAPEPTPVPPVVQPAPEPTPVPPVVEPAPAPSQPAPSVPAPSQPAPSVPAPSVPAPSQPAPSQPAPSVPAPSQPAPSSPAPSRHSPR